MNQFLLIVIFMSHQMSSPHIQPFDLREKPAESFFDSSQRTSQIIRTGFTQRMKM